MAARLEIEDGVPWYGSSNVWTVPGDNPEGPPGLPVEGQPCYVWARARNSGNVGVSDASVRFYWANPAVGFNRDTARKIGHAFVSLEPRETADVLCLTPFVPIFVNEGHECILAEVFHDVFDPLPAGVSFNVPEDRHVAQRNLSVVRASAAQTTEGEFSFAFEVHNASRRQRSFRVAVEEAEFDQLEPLLPLLSQDFELPAEKGSVQGLGFVASPCPSSDQIAEPSEPAVQIALGPFGRSGLSLVGKLEGQAGLVNVTQEADGEEVGGLIVLLLKGEQ